VSAGAARLVIDHRLVLVSTEPDLYYRHGTAEVTADVELVAGTTYRLVAEFSVESGIEMAGVRIGARPRPAADAQQRAVQAARDTDVAADDIPSAAGGYARLSVLSWPEWGGAL